MSRVISLIDQIKMHIMMWTEDDEYKKLSPQLKQAITMANNELKIRQAMIECGASELKPDETPVSKQRRIFIAIFKQKYLQFVDLKYEKQLTPVANKVLTTTIQKLLQQGSNSQQFLEWLWNDFFTMQRNKKYLPCDIIFACSDWIVDKFLYKHKEQLRVRKKDMIETGLKNKVIEVALQFMRNTQEKELGQKILVFSRGEMTLTKFVGIFNKFCEKHSNKQYKDRMSEIVKV